MKRESQADRLLQLLESANGEWVPAVVLPRISLSYTRRIFELRQLNHKIEMKEKWVDGRRQTAYRLVR
jgi:hypothetical protein